MHPAGGIAAGRVLLPKLVARPELDVADLEPLFEAALHADPVDQRLADLGAVVVGCTEREGEFRSRKRDDGH